MIIIKTPEITARPTKCKMAGGTLSTIMVVGGSGLKSISNCSLWRYAPTISTSCIIDWIYPDPVVGIAVKLALYLCIVASSDLACREAGIVPRLAATSSTRGFIKLIKIRGFPSVKEKREYAPVYSVEAFLLRKDSKPPTHSPFYDNQV